MKMDYIVIDVFEVTRYSKLNEIIRLNAYLSEGWIVDRVDSLESHLVYLLKRRITK